MDCCNEKDIIIIKLKEEVAFLKRELELCEENEYVKD